MATRMTRIFADSRGFFFRERQQWQHGRRGFLRIPADFFSERGNNGNADDADFTDAGIFFKIRGNPQKSASSAFPLTRKRISRTAQVFTGLFSFLRIPAYLRAAFIWYGRKPVHRMS